MDIKNVVKAAGLIVYRQIASQPIEFLLLQASYKDHHWSPPKGHVDQGEDDLTAAFRETEEEAGFKKDDLTLKEFQTTLDYRARGRPKCVAYWLAELKNPNQSVKLSKEHQNFRWCAIDEACIQADYEDMQQALKKAYDYLKS